MSLKYEPASEPLHIPPSQTRPSLLRREDIAEMVARAVAEEEFTDEKAKEWFEQDTFDKLLKEARFPPPSHRIVQRFRGGLVFKAHSLCVSLNWRRRSSQTSARKSGSSRTLSTSSSRRCGYPTGCVGHTS